MYRHADRPFIRFQFLRIFEFLHIEGGFVRHFHFVELDGVGFAGDGARIHHIDPDAAFSGAGFRGEDIGFRRVGRRRNSGF